MTGKAIMKKDTRLLLFQALERGSFEGSFIQKMKEEAVGMSLQFAKKYYKVTFEVYLTQASKCVLGVINLALVMQSDNDVDKAVKVLHKKSAKELFQYGWQEIYRLAEFGYKRVSAGHRTEDEKGLRYDKVEDTEKDYAERVSADPEKQWIGFDEYQSLKDINIPYQHKVVVENLLIKKYYHLNDDKTVFQSGIVPDKESFNQENMAINTIFMSLLVSDVPRAPLEVVDLDLIIEQLQERNIKAKLRKKLYACIEVPENMHPAFTSRINHFMSNVFTEILKSRREGGVSVTGQLLSNCIINPDPNAISARRYEQTRKSAEEMLAGVSTEEIDSIMAMFEVLEDVSDRQAYLEVLIKHTNKMTVTTLADFISACEPNEWANKINWAERSSDDFKVLMKSENMPNIVADIFNQQLEYKLLAYWQELPLHVLSEIMKEVEKSREFFLKNIQISHHRWIHASFGKATAIIFISVADWHELWFESGSHGSTEIFDLFVSAFENLSYSKQKIIKMLLPRVKVIAEGCKDVEALFDAPAPYYNKELKKGIKKVLTPAQFRSFTKKLKELVK